jgi:aldehyde:ferredoxin oxidoreductase
MNIFEHFYNMTIGVVDLAESSCEILPLDSAFLSEKIGGTSVTRALYERYRDDDPIVLGVGPLTGSYAPASCLLVITFLSPVTGTVSHIPMMHRAGPEMKFAGFDFLVVKHAASRPQFIYATEGTIDIRSADDVMDAEIPEVARYVRRTMHHARSMLVTGLAADRGLAGATVVSGMWGSPDKAGLAAAMASKNLKGLIFNGTDGLPFGVDNLERSGNIIRNLGLHGHSKTSGFVAVLEKMGANEAVKGAIRNYRARPMACYRCPFPCMSHVTFSYGGPSARDKDTLEMGVNLSDHMGFAALAARCRDNALALSEKCIRYGLDPMVVAGYLPEGGTTQQLRQAIEGDTFPTARGGSNAGKITDDMRHLVGGGIALIPSESGWAMRVGLSMTLGVCPLFMVMFPGLSERELLSFISIEKDTLAALEEKIDSAVRTLLEK